MRELSDNEEEKKLARPLTQNLSPLQTQGSANSRMDATSKITAVSELLRFELSGLDVTKPNDADHDSGSETRHGQPQGKKQPFTQIAAVPETEEEHKRDSRADTGNFGNMTEGTPGFNTKVQLLESNKASSGQGSIARRSSSPQEKSTRLQ